MHNNRIPSSRPANICGILCTLLILSGCSGDSDKNTSEPETTTTPTAGIPNNRPEITQDADQPEPQSNASFSISRTVELSGSQQIPVVSTRAAGRANLALNSRNGQLTGNVTHSVAEATSATVRLAKAGQNGDEIVTLDRVSNTNFAVPANTVITAQQKEDFEAGNLYVVISSSQHPAGEIRGQLTEEPVAFAVQSNLDDIQAKVFKPTCSGCHTGSGNTLPSVMDLTTADASYNSLVNFASLNEPDFLRVQASFSEESLLIRKLLGTQSVGSRMPFRGERLDTVVIDSIRDWINSGAPR